jgi:hypothetical protein
VFIIVDADGPDGPDLVAVEAEAVGILAALGIHFHPHFSAPHIPKVNAMIPASAIRAPKELHLGMVEALIGHLGMNLCQHPGKLCHRGPLRVREITSISEVLHKSLK